MSTTALRPLDETITIADLAPLRHPALATDVALHAVHHRHVVVVRMQDGCLSCSDPAVRSPE